MLSEPVLVDAGALIAIYSVKDPFHERCSQQVKDLPVGKTYTCWPVITEAAYLLRRYPAHRETLFAAIADGVFGLLPLESCELPEIQDIFDKYHDQDVDLADAALVHLADRENITTVFTIDRRHFGVYRQRNGEAFTLLP